MAANYLTSFDGAKIYYDKATNSPKYLIFIHGLGGSSAAWIEERKFFHDHNYSTIALDLRGHGFSSRGKTVDYYKFENFSLDLKALLKKEKIKNPIIIGHCFGGMVAIHFAASHPTDLKSLILVDTSFKPPYIDYDDTQKLVIDYFIELLLKFAPSIFVKGHIKAKIYAGTGDYDPRRITNDILHTSLKSYLSICENLVGFNAQDLLRKILVPTLIIEGSDDSIFPPEVARYLQKRIKKSELEMIDGANHILVINNPKDLSETIYSYLNKIKE